MTYFHSLKAIGLFTLVVAGFSAAPVFAELSINPYPLTTSSANPGAPVRLTPPPAAPRAQAMPSVNLSKPQSWNAFSGANIKDIIGHWSETSGVELIWNTNERYDVPQNLDYTGSYEEAVSALLEQYNDRFIRPVGTLHVDPSSGQKTLVITTHEGS